MLTSIEWPLSQASSATASNAQLLDKYVCPAQDEKFAVGHTLDGDLDAFNEHVLKYQQLAFSVAFRMLHAQEAAADAVQDSLNNVNSG